MTEYKKLAGPKKYGIPAHHEQPEHQHCETSSIFNVISFDAGSSILQSRTSSVGTHHLALGSVDQNNQSTMCCRYGRRRTPLTIVLARAAYNAYKNHKEKKRIEAQQQEDFEKRAIPEQTLSDAMPGLKLEQSGIAPPHYDEVVQVHRTVLPDEPTCNKVRAKETAGWDEEDVDRDSLSDADSLLADELSTTKTRDVGYKETQARSTSRGERRALRREQKRREWEEWKAEKAARRAARVAARTERRGTGC